MQKTLMKIINELMKMKDDEKFCKAEYDAVQDYCCKKDFQLSKEERKIIHDIGLEKSFLFWMESQGKRIGYQVVYEHKGYLLSAEIRRFSQKRKLRKNTGKTISNTLGQIGIFFFRKLFMTGKT